MKHRYVSLNSLSFFFFLSLILVFLLFFIFLSPFRYSFSVSLYLESNLTLLGVYPIPCRWQARMRRDKFMALASYPAILTIVSRPLVFDCPLLYTFINWVYRIFPALERKERRKSEKESLCPCEGDYDCGCQEFIGRWGQWWRKRVARGVFSHLQHSVNSVGIYSFSLISRQREWPDLA